MKLVNWMALWRAFICNEKGLAEVEKVRRRWIYFTSLTKFIREIRLQSIISVRHLVDCKPTNYALPRRQWINIYYQFLDKRRENYYLNLGKRNVKNLKIFKHRWTRTLSRVGAGRVRALHAEEMYLPNPGNWPTFWKYWWNT